MHNKSLSELFNLIHALSKGEKRYFKLYARSRSSHLDNINYIDLFDAIAKQQEYNEEQIVQLGIVKKAHLRMLKNYLYNLIMESLRSLHSKGENIDNRLTNMLKNMHIMRDKGLQEEEIKYFTKAKALALKHERWGIALEAMLGERKAAIRMQDFKALKRIKTEMKLFFTKLNNLKEYMVLQGKVSDFLQKAGMQRGIKNSILKKLMAHPLLKDENKGLSVESKGIYYNTLLHYYFFMGNNAAGYKMIAKHMRLLYDTGIQLPELTYMGLLNNFTIVQHNLGKYEEAYSTIQKHRSLLKKSETAKEHALIDLYINEINHYIFTGMFEKGAALVKEVENKIDTDKAETPAAILLYYNIATIYFYQDNYHKALLWINKIINRPHFSFREDMQSWARILQLLIHYELNTPDITDHLIISVYRFLLKREKLYKVEKSILNFIRRLSKIDATRKALLEEFRRFRNELLKITKSPDEKKALEYFDLISWLKSKIENRSLAEIVREKIQK